MADLTDEEKAKAFANENVEKDITAGEQTSEQIEEQENQEAEEQEEVKPEQEKPAEETESEAETPPTFTKQFQNLKGDNWNTYGPELETAYQNSFNEALRLVEENKQLKAQTQALATQPAAAEQAPATPQVTPDVSSSPEMQYAKAQMQKDMVDAFNDFAKEYPQARDQADFKRFSDASAGVYQAFQAANGRMPTYPELYSGIAHVLDWQAASQGAKKDAAIKDSLSQSAPSGGGQQTQRRPAKVTDAQVNAYIRLLGPVGQTKDRAEAVKELSEVA